ncbi:MAG: (d)CMP kinase [Planctomycetota bacterium]
MNDASTDRASDPTEVVAIDGPSGAGKSTVAKMVAQKLGYQYLDTGAMYRAVTWHFLSRDCAPGQHAPSAAADTAQAEQVMRRTLAEMRLQLQGGGRVLVDGREVTAHLRSHMVEARVSAVSALPFVRQAMTELQREVARHGPVVAEGRDMGSVVFPHARWKVFLTAEPRERARRRQRDFAARGREVSERETLAEIEVRDRLDSTRRDAPLVQAADATCIDSTGRSTEQVVDAILALVRGR